MTMRSNKAIVNAAGQTITTAGLAAGGALNPEQAQKFIQQTFEATPLSGLVRHELRKAKTGEIDKIGVGRRLLRKKTENTDDGKPCHGQGCSTDCTQGTSQEYQSCGERRGNADPAY